MSNHRSEKVHFTNAAGDRLAARLERPAGEVIGYALLAHCFTCGKDLKPMRRISRSLAEEGIAVLRFDFTGIGESQGDFAETDFSSNVDDLVAAADFLREEYEAPELLVGHSLGGTAVLMAASRIEEVRAVSTIAAPSDTDHLRERLVEKAPEIQKEGTAEIELAGRTFRVKRELLEDLAEQKVRDAVAALRRPLLLFHSPVDNVVGIDHARRLFEATKHPKSFMSLDDADHLLIENENDARYAGHILAVWAKRYLGKSAEDARESETKESSDVQVTGGPSGLVQQIAVGRHHFLSDEPEDAGGKDAGPDPYDLLLAGLGACTGMTLRMYADRKGWPLRKVRVRLEHSRIHASDCEECETQKGKVDRIERLLELEGDLSEEQRERLVEMADRCPVSRTLTTETRIETRLE